MGALLICMQPAAAVSPPGAPEVCHPVPSAPHQLLQGGFLQWRIPVWCGPAVERQWDSFRACPLLSVLPLHRLRMIRRRRLRAPLPSCSALPSERAPPSTAHHTKAERSAAIACTRYAPVNSTLHRTTRPSRLSHQPPNRPPTTTIARPAWPAPHNTPFTPAPHLPAPDHGSLPALLPLPPPRRVSLSTDPP